MTEIFSRGCRITVPPRVAGGGTAVVRSMLLTGAVLLGVATAQAKPPVPLPLEVSTVEDLRFGTVAGEGDGAGWVTVAPVGGVTTGGSLVALGGDKGPAVFEITGVPYGGFQIAVPNRLRLDRDVLVREFSSYPAWSGVLDGDGRATVRVGGRLEVKSRASAGSYSAPLQIQVNYQ